MNRYLIAILYTLMVLGYPAVSRAAGSQAVMIAPSGYLGPGYSDCQPYVYTTGGSAVNGKSAYLCPILDFAITAAAGPHTIQPTEWSGLEVASGGVTVPFVLPNSPPRGPHSVVNFATDGATGFTLNSQPPATMQGTAPVVNGVITAGPGAAGWALWNGTVYNVGIYQGNPVTGMH